MTEFEAVGVLEKASHPPSEKSAARATIPAQTGSGKRKDEVLGDLSPIRNLSYRLAAQRMSGGDDGTRKRGLCRDSCVKRAYNNIKDTPGAAKAAQKKTNNSKCVVWCGGEILTVGAGNGYCR